MSLSSWRQFPFFDCLPIQDPNYGSHDGSTLYSDSSVSSICSTPKFFVMASKDATIKFADSSFQLVCSFHAYEPTYTITKLCYIDGGNGVSFLCSVGETQGQPLSVKLWDIAKIVGAKQGKEIDFNSDYHTLCLVSNGSNNYPLTCFSNSADFSVLAFGFANGSVILVRGDLLHDRGSRQRVVYQSEEPVTGVHFKDDSLLYVTTISKVVTIATSGRNKGKPERILEDRQGADINCSDIAIKDGRKSLIVARQEGLQFYNSKGRTNSLLIDVPKKRLYSFGGGRYIFLLTSNTSNDFTTHSMLVLDTIDKFVAFSRTVASSAIEVFTMWDDLYVFTTDGLLYKLHEKPFDEKLDILVQRDLFSTAIKLAHEGSIDKEEVMKIELQYGNYLYERGESSDAIDHYMNCIELGKTNEVIQKYKESSRIPYLTRYLEKMVELGISTSDHVTLLLCAYCKLKQDNKIHDFVDSIASADSATFDLDTVINLCRESGYYMLAAFIAKKFNLPSVVVDIQLQDLKSPKLTMRYIKGLNIDDLLRVLLDNVKALLDKLPNESTQLLIDVFTGRYKPDTSFDLDQVSTTSSATERVDHPILTSYQQFVTFMSGGATEEAITNGGGIIAGPTYLPPRPKIIFQCFVNHPNEFVIFLEACVESYDKFGGNAKDKKDIMVTLYEMYLTLASDSDDRSQWEAKAKTLLQTIQKENGWTLEENTGLLLLSTVSDFNEGEILIREIADESSEGFGLDLFRSAVMSENYARSYEIIEKYGDKEPDLYRLGLSIYTANEQVYKTVGEERITNIINHIEANKLMTPLELIKQLSLSNNGFVKLSLVKGYLLNYIRRQKLEIDNNTKLIKSYREDSEKIEKEIDDLAHNSKTVNQARCSSCGQPLDFPVIHFKCSHSYHEHCLSSNGQPTNEEGMVCPRCASQNETMDVVKEQQREVAERNDTFKASLEGSSDRFKVMMGFVGRGGMESTRVLYEPLPEH